MTKMYSAFLLILIWVTVSRSFYIRKNSLLLKGPISLKNPLTRYDSKQRVFLKTQTKQPSPSFQQTSSSKHINDIQNEKSKRVRAKSRRKGPQARSPVKEETKVGRVSVYCVGSGIDLQALRAHIFRKGFGNRGARGNDSIGMSLGGRAEDPDLADKVLHVTNGPSFIISDNRITAVVNDNERDWPTTAKEEKTTVNKENQSQSESDESSSTITSLHESNEELEDQMHWKTKEMLLMSSQDIFYYAYGCVVMWGLSPGEEKAALTELAAFTIDPVTATELENSFDTMEYQYDRGPGNNLPMRSPQIKFDRMKLQSLRLEERLAVSYAMAQSSKLFVFESQVLQSVERTRFLPKTLAKEGKIHLTKRELNRLIGQLFVEQTEVNLFSSILDTPDFLWEDDEYFPTYQDTRGYLEVDTRVELLNNRLSVIRELLDVLNAQVADNNSTRLEWIVIWLIIMEMGLSIMTGPWFTGKPFQVVMGLLAGVCLSSAIALYRIFGDN